MKIQELNNHILTNNESGKTASNLKSGDVFRAQIINSNPNEVTIKLQNGETLNAKLASNLNLADGEFLNFSVSDIKNGKIFLETIKRTSTSEASQGEIKNILKGLDIPVNDKNLELLKNMLKNDLPVTKENFINLQKNLLKNPSLDSAKVIFMMANKLDPTEKNIKKLNQYLDGKIALNKQISGLINQFDAMNDENILNKANAILESLEIIEEDSIQEQETSLPTSKNLKEAVILAIKETFEKIDKNAKPTGQSQILEDLEALLLNNKKDPNMSKLSFLLEKNKLNFEDLKKILETYMPSTEVDSKALKQNIKKHLENHMVKIDSKSLGDDLNVNSNFKELLIKFEVLKEALSMPGYEKMLASMNEATDNIKFLNNLSQYNTYMQVPLNIWGKDTTGDILFLKKSNKKIDPDNASIFLSLDMPNMGPTEVLVNVSSKNVSINVRVSDKSIIKEVNGSSIELSDKIKATGYNLSFFDCTQMVDKTNIANIKSEITKKTQKKNIDFKI